MKFRVVKNENGLGETYYIDDIPVNPSTYFRELHMNNPQKFTLNNATPEEWDKASYNEAKDKWDEDNRSGNKALGIQIGGKHYQKFKIQPVEFCYKNEIPYLEATAIKYLCRHREKNKAEDLKKAIHFIQLLLEFEYEENM